MARREVQLVITAKDEASGVTKAITDALKRFAASEKDAASAAGQTTTQIDALVKTLASLSKQGGGLAAFSKLTTTLDRAAGSVGKLEQELIRSQQSLQGAAQKAGTASGALLEISTNAERANAALNETRATLAAQEAVLAGLNSKVTQASNAYKTIRAELTASKGPSDALKASVATQRDALIALIEAQTRQQAVVSQTNAAVSTQQKTYNALSKDVTAAGKAVSLANAEFAKQGAATQDAATVLELERQNLSKIDAEAKAAGAALGGLAANQEAVSAASKSTATQISRVADALVKQQAAARGAQSEAALRPAAQATADFRAQIAAVNGSKAAYEEATAQVARYADVLDHVRGPATAIRAEQTLAIAQAGQLKRAYQDQAAALNQTRQAIAASASARQAAIAATNSAKAAEDAYNQSLLGTIRNLIGLKSPAQQAAAALAKVEAAQKRASDIAANPDKKARQDFQRSQNLAFQVNDLATQLASGTSPLRAIGQQAGQILQLIPSFNTFLVTLLRFIPALAAVGALLSPVIAAFINLGNAAKTQREFNIALAGTEQAATTSTAALTATARALDEYGGSLKDAVGVEQAFLKAGLDPSHFESLGRSVHDVAKALGQEAPEAAAELGKALRGNLSDILALDEKTNILTKTERERLLALELQTDAQGRAAREQEKATIVAEAYQRRGDAIKDAAEGPWTQAFAELGRAFNDVVHAFENTGVVQALGDSFNQLATNIKNAATEFRIGFAFLTNGFNAAKAIQTGTSGAGTASGRGGNPLAADSAAAQRDAIRRAQAQGELNKKIAEENDLVVFKTQIAGKSKAAQAGLLAIRKAQTEADKAGLTISAAQALAIGAAAAQEVKLTEARKAGESQAKKSARAQKEFNEQITKENEQRLLNAELVQKTARQQAIEGATGAAEIRAKQAGAVFSQKQREEVERTAAIEFDARGKRAADIEHLQSQIKLREILGQKIDINKQLEEEAIIQQRDLATDAGKQWEKDRRAELEATKAVQDFTDAQQLVVGLQAQLRDGERDLAQARKEGASLQDLQDRHAALEDLSAQLVVAKDAAIKLGEAIPGKAGEIEKLKGVSTEVRQIKDELITAAEVNDRLAEGLANGFVNAGEELGKVIDGTQSWSDALENIGDTFRQFAADFLIEIAKMIAKQAILTALQGASKNGGVGGFIASAITSLFHGGGRVGDSGQHRQIDPRAFIGAKKYHGGGTVGLQSNEEAAILKKGEVVLTEQQAAAQKNARAAGVSVINTIDPSSFISKGLNAPEGGRAIMNFITDNSREIKGVLQ